MKKLLIISCLFLFNLNAETYYSKLKKSETFYESVIVSSYVDTEQQAISQALENCHSPSYLEDDLTCTTPTLTHLSGGFNS